MIGRITWTCPKCGLSNTENGELEWKFWCPRCNEKHEPNIVNWRGRVEPEPHQIDARHIC